jgi:hypothetical protein
MIVPPAGKILNPFTLSGTIARMPGLELMIGWTT